MRRFPTNYSFLVPIMREIKNEPILTDMFDEASSFTPPNNSFYFFAHSHEYRSHHISSWRAKTTNVTFFEIVEEQPHSFKLLGDDHVIFLRGNGLSNLLSPYPAGTVVYIDITGLTHSVWASLLRAALNAKFDVRVIYVEPQKYKRSTAPVEGEIYDLSTKINGITPLPGYTLLSPQTFNEFDFVPLLGFEGARLRHVTEKVQPAADRIIPIVGSPGFKPWYVFETYLGNRSSLTEEGMWQRVRYAPANCPFSCYYLLTEIAENTSSRLIKVALTGTKPHALGAVLFALTKVKPEVELIYDHPIRKDGRSEGSDRLLVYYVSSIIPALNTRTLVTR